MPAQSPDPKDPPDKPARATAPHRLRPSPPAVLLAERPGPLLCGLPAPTRTPPAAENSPVPVPSQLLAPAPAWLPASSPTWSGQPMLLHTSPTPASCSILPEADQTGTSAATSDFHAAPAFYR